MENYKTLQSGQLVSKWKFEPWTSYRQSRPTNTLMFGHVILKLHV